MCIGYQGAPRSGGLKGELNTLEDTKWAAKTELPCPQPPYPTWVTSSYISSHSSAGGLDQKQPPRCSDRRLGPEHQTSLLVLGPRQTEIGEPPGLSWKYTQQQALPRQLLWSPNVGWGGGGGYLDGTSPVSRREKMHFNKGGEKTTGMALGRRETPR